MTPVTAAGNLLRYRSRIPDERKGRTMLRSTIERSPFSALLGAASVYAIVTSLGIILMADGLTRVPVLWPHITTLW